MFHSMKIAAFKALSKTEQATVWESFFEALDMGGAGFHQFYEVLAPLYAQGDYITGADLDFDAEENLALASWDTVEGHQLELAIEIGDPAF
jgi:hypothetical protein